MILDAQREEHGSKFVFGEIDGIGARFTPEIIDRKAGQFRQRERRRLYRLIPGIRRGVDSRCLKCRGLCRGEIQILTI